MKTVQLFLGFVIIIGELFVLPWDMTPGAVVTAAVVGVGIWIVGMLAAGDKYEGVYKPGSVFAKALPVVVVLAAGALLFLFIFGTPTR